MDKKVDTQAFLDRYLTPIAVLVGALIIAGVFMFGNAASRDGADAGGQPQAETADIKNIDIKGDPYVGDPNAPVVMAVWFDYQCPFCKRFDQDTLAQVYENYVKTGKVKVVFQDFQFLGPDSNDAALFARAVWEAYPDQFYAWYQAMFEAQDEEHGGFGDTDSIVTMTKQKLPGIDTTKLLALIAAKEGAYQKAIDADRADGAAVGVNGTPGTLIGKELIAGAQPYATIATAIEAALK